jgi:Bacterial Ig domain/HYR domain
MKRTKVSVLLAFAFLLCHATDVAADYDEEIARFKEELALCQAESIDTYLFYERDAGTSADQGMDQALLVREEYGGYPLLIPMQLAYMVETYSLITPTYHEEEVISMSHDFEDMASALSSFNYPIEFYKTAERGAAGGVFNTIVEIDAQNTQILVGKPQLKKNIIRPETAYACRDRFADAIVDGGHIFSGLALHQSQAQLVSAILTPDVISAIVSLAPGGSLVNEILGNTAGMVSSDIGDSLSLDDFVSLGDLAIKGIEIGGKTLWDNFSVVGNIIKAGGHLLRGTPVVAGIGEADLEQMSLNLSAFLNKLDTRLFVDARPDAAAESKLAQNADSAQNDLMHEILQPLLAQEVGIEAASDRRIARSDFTTHGLPYTKAAVFLRGPERPNQEPVIQDISGFAIKRGECGSCDIRVMDADGDEIDIYLKGCSPCVLRPINELAGPGLFVAEFIFCSDADSPSTFNVTVAATDNRSPNVEATFAVSILNTPPILLGISSQTYRTGEILVIEGIVASDVDTNDVITLLLGEGSPGSLDIREKGAGFVKANYTYQCESNCPDSFDITIEVSDSRATSATTFQVVRINAPPDFDPTANYSEFDVLLPAGDGRREVYIMDPDWEQAFCFTAIDLDGDALEFYVNRSPRYGQAGVLASGSNGHYEVHATYLPNSAALVTAHDLNRPLQDSFTIVTRDEYGGRDEARVNVQINVLNRIPDAVDDGASTDQNVAVSIAVLDNDSDGDGDTLSIASLTQPPHGRAAISGRQIVYTPDTGYVGDDAFSYTLSDGHGGSATASVDVEVILVDFTPPTITCPLDIDVSADFGRCDASPNVGTATATDNLCTPTVTGVRSDSRGLSEPYLVGTTSIVWTARDDAGNTDSCTQTVTVRDEQLPIISGCPGDQVVSCDPGACSATVSWTAPTADDNCGIASFASTHSPGDSFAKGGPTTITYTATDVHGNADTCSFTVTVLDDEDPVIANCPGDMTTDLQPGTCTVPVNWTAPTANDNCDGVMAFASRSHAPGSSFGTGTTTVAYHYTDSSGNTAICSFDVTVNDTVAPVISCPGDMAVGTDADACGTTVTYSVTAVDPCGASIEQLAGLPSGSLFPIGMTVNRFRAIDAAGNTDICEFGVDVSDDTDPVISGCLGNLTVSCGASQCSATATWTEPTATDNCGLASFSGDHAPGETFSLGTTTVTYTAIDIHGNQSDCSFTITVVDDRDPDISGCPGDITVDALFGGCSRSVSWTEPTATDNCDGALSYISRSHSPGSSFDVGTTEVTYTFRDSAGNSDQCRFDVTVRDTTAPSISCPSDITVDADTTWGANVFYNTPSASDNCDSSVSVQCSPSSGSWFWNGDTTVTCIAEDDSGNEDTCTFEVTVEENHSPVAVNDSVMMSTGQGAIVIDALRNDYDWDNDNLEIISASTSCGDAHVSENKVEYWTMNCSAPAGSTVTVYYTISDGRGGTDSATISVRLPSAGPMSYP